MPLGSGINDLGSLKYSIMSYDLDMTRLVEMDERVSIFAQMEENMGPVILINNSASPQRISIVFYRDGQLKLRNLRSNQDSSQHNYTKVSVQAAHSLTMQFGNPLHISRRRLMSL
jgi:hypothetical protein